MTSPRVSPSSKMAFEIVTLTFLPASSNLLIHLVVAVLTAVGCQCSLADAVGLRPCRNFLSRRVIVPVDDLLERCLARAIY